MATPAQVLQDPNFHQLPQDQQILVMQKLDPNFANLSGDEQTKVLSTGAQITQSKQGQPGFIQRTQQAYDQLQSAKPEDIGLDRWSPGGVGMRLLQGAADTLAPIVHPEDTARAAIQSLTHPSTASIVGGPAGGMLQSAAKAAINDPVRFAGQTVTGTAEGELASPVAGALMRGAERGALLGRTPEGAYESALKPSTTIPAAQRANMVQTGLENAIPVSKNGLAKIGGRIDELNQAIANEIAADPTKAINTVPALRNLDAVRARFSNQVTPQPDLAEINQVQSNFVNNPKLQPQGAGPGPGSLPASDAQAMKQGTYQALGNKAYGELKGASIEAQKALARGLKEEIAVQFPEIGNLNAEESRLLDLQPVLERAVNRTANHQLIGIGTPVASAATKAVTGSSGAGAVAGVMKAVLDNPMVKSRLAIAISKGGAVPYAQAAARVAAYSSALGSTASAPQATQGDQTAGQTP